MAKAISFVQDTVHLAVKLKSHLLKAKIVMPKKFKQFVEVKASNGQTLSFVKPQPFGYFKRVSAYPQIVFLGLDVNSHMQIVCLAITLELLN